MTTGSAHPASCIIIGASHAGVNCAFALRREGWSGTIHLIDSDPMLPYHRPPLSKTYLTSDDGIEKNILKSAESYEQQNIHLSLGTFVKSINRTEKTITLGNNQFLPFDKLVLATGARPLIPQIKGLEISNNIFTMRTAQDALAIREAFHESVKNKKTVNEKVKVVVIGAGYIGLETAASLRKLGATVTVLEREDRILKRVTTPYLSQFFHDLHIQNGVALCLSKNVVAIQNKASQKVVICSDGSQHEADFIIVGVGIKVNTELAATAQLKINNGIVVDATCQTSDSDIYAIGDCTFHHNPHYDCHIRLESVQNAVDQAKVAAAAICGNEVIYDSIPWFWSDQYDIKLQMVGLSDGFDQTTIRTEADKENSFSVWYFKEDQLLAVDAINNAKAYVLGTKFIKTGQALDKKKLADPTIALKPANLLEL